MKKYSWINISENVEFCGYSIPHPSEHLVNLRIQASEPMNVFLKGLDDLVEMFEHIKAEYQK